MPNRVGQGSSEDLMRNGAVTRECRSGTECGTFSRSIALRMRCRRAVPLAVLLWKQPNVLE